ncbi:lisH domain-containing protein FOPNL-like isoform X1 [Trichogramma pretiosum]|uniref:lisH domain-containing protein FOPNL-like isoform X1 n=1 Tax=Trichogramma pretiosum TaxID=7493 RepID=UPI0006C943F9|nr:lisH domain-containing protein FOPNL-like isoform X1 [Trichogramma pretiosum]
MLCTCNANGALRVFRTIELHTKAITVRTSLESDGALSQIKAEMRTKVMQLLEGSNKSSRSKHPKSPQEVLILNELIREYLEWMGYKYASNVLITECELSKQPLDRNLITKDLGIIETEKSKELPLLFCILETFKEIKSA